MFEYLKKYKVILVSGPQRSGTTICARMIANDTGYEYLDEKEFKVHEKKLFIHLINECLDDKRDVVIQCPGMSRYVHEFNDDRIAVVFMMRNVENIQESQRRIKWKMAYKEYPHYKDVDLPDLERNNNNIAILKYNYWNTYQKNRTRNAYEVQHRSLRNHKLWLNKDNRVNFTSRQWRLDK